MAFRIVGYVLVTPLAEELAFRAFLTRRLEGTHFERLPLGHFSWFAFLASSVLFGALHGQMWIAGTLAGMAFAAALYRRGVLADAVVAHAVTNAALAVYAAVTGQWSVWS
jgi:CAAX prenyl protease-like protein